MQHENSLLEFDSVCSTERASLGIFDNLQDARTPKAFKYFGRNVLLSALSKIQGMTKKLANTNWQRHQIFFATANPYKRFFFLIRHDYIIPEQI